MLQAKNMLLNSYKSLALRNQPMLTVVAIYNFLSVRMKFVDQILCKCCAIIELISCMYAVEKVSLPLI